MSRQTIEDFVGDAFARVDRDGLLTAVELLSRHDRYQASAGLDAAADLVAELAERAGLVNVSISRHPGDGRPRWWSFEAPLSWTPARARLSVQSPSGRRVDVDHSVHPFAVATYSAPTQEAGISAPLRAWVSSPDAVNLVSAGAVVLVSPEDYVRGGLLEDLRQAGVIGFVTAAPAKGTNGEARGRIELPMRSGIFAFSLTAAEAVAVRSAAGEGATAVVDVALGPACTMPVVTGELPRSHDDAEAPVWLTAHLCHPRPSSNDNASGVAGLLAVAQVLARHPDGGSRSRGVHFTWGPEFLGTAALIHECLEAGTRRLPAAVINLDMIGEEQAICASPFVVERSSDLVPSLVNPLAECVVSEVFRRTAQQDGRWEPSPFLGFSDHALFADPAVGRPAVQFCHPHDRFNHSAGDRPDKVSPVEMVRSVAASAALTEVLIRPSGADVGHRVARWRRRELGRARAVAGRYFGQDPVWADAYLRNARVALDAMSTLAATSHGTALPLWRAAPDRPSIGPRRTWSGPLNVRAMLAAGAAGARQAFGELVAVDKMHLSVAFNTGIRIDGHRTWERIFSDVSFALERPLRSRVTDVVQELFLTSGWVDE